MSRRKPPRLYLKQRHDRRDVWIIRDRARRISTGCGEHDLEKAEQALAVYIAGKYEPPRGLGSALLISEVLALYLKDHAAHSPSKQSLFGASRPILEWWAGKKISDVNGTRCRAYACWRVGHGVSDQTARHDLKIMKAAIRWYKREHDPGIAVPLVTLPAQAEQRKDYWLTRVEVAARLRAAWRNPHTRHVARLILIGIYSGTRPGAILRLRWLPSPSAGWFDLDRAVLHRTGAANRPTNKRQPLARIHARLLPRLRRWKKADTAQGISTVIHYRKMPVEDVGNAWERVAKRAAAGRKDGPHILRHTCATWLMQRGVDAFEAAGFLGMSARTLWEVYGHHHPNFQDNAAGTGGRLGAGTRERGVNATRSARTKEH